jgi:hypothetical protein
MISVEFAVITASKVALFSAGLLVDGCVTGSAEFVSQFVGTDMHETADASLRLSGDRSQESGRPSYRAPQRSALAD